METESTMPQRRAVRLLVPALLLAFAATAVHAQGQPSKGEQALKYRKAVYQAIAWNFGPMSQMAQGKVPYDSKEFELRAGRVAALAPMLSESYSADSRGVTGSKAKPELWTERADFDAKMKDLVERSAALATVAKAGDAAKSKQAFLDTAATCKACHDKYKAD
jgi:cytochrome c556